MNNKKIPAAVSSINGKKGNIRFSFTLVKGLPGQILCPKQTCLKLPLSIFRAPRMLFDRDVTVWEREKGHSSPSTL